MTIISLFCRHQWVPYVKKDYNWNEKQPIKGTEYWMKPIFHTVTVEETLEILICSECGMVKKITY